MTTSSWYFFELLESAAVGASVLAFRRTWLNNSAAAWPVVADIARNAKGRGGIVRVKDEAGEIVILTGVASALAVAA